MNHSKPPACRTSSKEFCERCRCSNCGKRPAQCHPCPCRPLPTYFDQGSTAVSALFALFGKCCPLWFLFCKHESAETSQEALSKHTVAHCHHWTRAMGHRSEGLSDKATEYPSPDFECNLSLLSVVHVLAHGEYHCCHYHCLCHCLLLKCLPLPP